MSSPRFPYYKFLNVLHFAVSSDRKMCVVLQHILARGPLRAPVASPSPWLFQGIEPVPEPADRIAGQSLAGLGEIPLHLHRTMDQRAYRRPLKPTRGRLRSPCTHRSLQEDHRAIAPLGTLSLDLETCLSTNTEPCTNDCPFDHQSGERSCFPQYPHDHFMETNLPQFGCAPCHGDDFIETRKGARRSCPCLGTIPSTKDPSRPLDT